MLQTPTKPELRLVIPHAIGIKVTPAQFEALAIANRDLRLERKATGELIVNPPTGWETGEQNWNLSGELYIWWCSAGKPGKAFDSSTGFILPNGATRSPDASWISRQRWEALTPEEKGTFTHICPDFVVELRSASDRLSDLQDKMVEYMENGALLGWLINPKQRQVEIYRQRQNVEVLQNPVEVSGEDILPGFVLKLPKLWGHDE